MIDDSGRHTGKPAKGLIVRHEIFSSESVVDSGLKIYSTELNGKASITGHTVVSRDDIKLLPCHMQELGTEV